MSGLTPGPRRQVSEYWYHVISPAVMTRPLMRGGCKSHDFKPVTVSSSEVAFDRSFESACLSLLANIGGYIHISTYIYIYMGKPSWGGLKVTSYHKKSSPNPKPSYCPMCT